MQLLFCPAAERRPEAQTGAGQPALLVERSGETRNSPGGCGYAIPTKKRGVCEGGKPPLPERVRKRNEVKKAGSVSERHLRQQALLSLLQPGPPRLPSPAVPEQGTGKRVPPEVPSPKRPNAVAFDLLPFWPG